MRSVQIVRWVLCLQSLQAEAAGQKNIWLNNYEKARVKAEVLSVPVIVFFSGSDWCGWCQKLHRELFSSEVFISAANKDFVAVLLDYPRKKRLPLRQKRQNEIQLQRWEIDGFPTVLVINPKGKSHVVMRHGYLDIEPDDYLDAIRDLKL